MEHKLEREKIESIIESLLLVGGEPLSLKRFGELISEASRSEVQAALEELKRRWEGAAGGIRLVEVAGGFQLQTAEDNAAWVGKLIQSRPVRLSRPALECLAIIAYKQPLTRMEIDEVRGVDSGGVLKTLLEHGFIKIAGRKDVAGKPLIYATDKRFMEFFRLKSLAELPTLKELAEIQEERLLEARERGELPLEETPGAEGATGEGEPEGAAAGEEDESPAGSADPVDPTGD